MAQTGLTDFNGAETDNADNTDNENDTPTEPLEINSSEDAHDQINQFIDQILDAANKDTDTEETKEEIVEYLTVSASTSFRRYSKKNKKLLFIQLQHRDNITAANAQHFAGFNTWLNEHNRHVSEGETGLHILAPVTGPACPQCGNAPSYHKNDWVDCDRAGTDPDTWDINPRDEWSEGVYYFRNATTFAYEQTEPVEDADPEDVFTPPEETRDVDADEADRAAELRDALTHAAENATIDPLDHEVNVTIGEARNASEFAANGVSYDGSVHVTPRDNPEEFGTLTHEIAHEILDHHDTFGQNSQYEIEAETVAATVCNYFGVSTRQDYSELYLANWADAARDLAGNDEDTEPRDIIEDRLDVVQETATGIIEALEAELE